MLPASVGLGWRPETAWLVDTRGITFSEVIAENIDPRRPPRALAASIERGLVVATHGVSLSLGSAQPPERAGIARLAAVAKALRSPIVSEHVAFSRAGDLRAEHFLPVPFMRAELAVLVDHVRRVADALPVPLALENIAAPFVWPGAELAEADMLAELIDRTGTYLLLDVANLVANLANHGGDLDAYLDRLPLDRVAYVHMAGGARVGEMWRDTHAHAIPPATLDALDRVLARTGRLPVLLERDHAFDSRSELDHELDILAARLASAPSIKPPHRATTPTSLPPPDRHVLGRTHHEVLAALLAPDGAAPPGMPAHHWSEVRAIHANKRKRLHPHTTAGR